MLQTYSEQGKYAAITLTLAIVGQSLGVGGCVYCSPCSNPCWNIVQNNEVDKGHI